MTLDNNNYAPKDEEEEEGFMALFGGLSFSNISSMLLAPDVVERCHSKDENQHIIVNNNKNSVKTYTDKDEMNHDQHDEEENVELTSDSDAGKVDYCNEEGENYGNGENYDHELSIRNDDINKDSVGANTTVTNTKREIMSSLYQRAFQQSSVDGQLLKPSVQIVDMSHEMKGNIMIASRSFSKGEIIFSERALEGVQMPRGICIKCKLSSTSPPWSEENHKAGINNKKHRLYNIRGCQQCFKSLEPASCLLDPNKCADQDNNKSNEMIAAVPLSHLWPIPEYTESKKHNETQAFEGNDKLWMDSAGRITCERCSSIFCNRYCAKNHLEAIGDCCVVVDAIVELIHAVYCCCAETNSTSVAGDEDDGNRSGNDDAYLDIDPVLLLATRMFCVLVNRNRKATSSKGFANDPFECLCGGEEDITPLRLGLFDNESGRYTLERAYEAISSLFQLSSEERENYLSLKVFHKTAAVAQRNAISLMTGSPFRTYYQSMIRETGGRGSARQKQVSCNIAYILGSHDGILTRDMDKVVEDKVRT
jgi:hypothetical protein